MAAKNPQGPGGGAEPEAERRNLQQRFEGPQQLPLPTAGQTLHTQGEVTWDEASLCTFIHLSFVFMGCHVVAAVSVY